MRPSCELNPCLNDGTCVELDSPPYYRCICAQMGDVNMPLGPHCEPLSACDSMPCPEHSTCVLVDDHYKCVCHDDDDDDCRHSAAGALTSLGSRDILGT